MKEITPDSIFNSLFDLVKHDEGATKVFMVENEKVATASLTGEGSLIEVYFHLKEINSVRKYEDPDEAAIEIYYEMKRLN